MGTDGSGPSRGFVQKGRTAALLAPRTEARPTYPSSNLTIMNELLRSLPTLDLLLSASCATIHGDTTDDVFHDLRPGP